MRPLIYAAMLLIVFSTDSAAETTVVSKQKTKGKDYGWLFQFLDRNNNSVIDPGDVAQMPPPMRNWMLKNGIGSRQGISRKRFLQFAPQMMESVRNGKLAPLRSQPPSVIVVETLDLSSRLPVKYRPSDKNGDGQIGFYEWNWHDSATFSTLDLNDDGFLTPRELGAPSPKLTRKSKKIPRSPRRVFQEKTRTAFDKADRNRDGQLSAKEWSRTPPAKQITEASDRQPQFPMPFPQFSDYYRNRSVNGGN